MGAEESHGSMPRDLCLLSVVGSVEVFFVQEGVTGTE
jgi:hypothetical protein